MTQDISAADYRRLFAPSKSGAHKRKEQPALDLRTSSGRGFELHLGGVTHPPINEWKSWHWRKYNAEKKRWREMILPFTRTMYHVAIGSRVAVEVVFRFPDHRRHDPDNYSPKFILDALVAGKVLPDDDCRVVRKLLVECLTGCAYPGTSVILLP